MSRGDRARVVKIDGAPGVGKTTRLEQAVLDERDNGRSITDVYYITFARSGREESALALAEAYPDIQMEDVRSRAKTFHGVAYTTCAQNDLFENPDVQIITQRDDEHVFKQFCQRRGLRYVGESGNVLKKIRNGEDLSAAGDRLFAVAQWLTLKQYPPEQYHRAPQDLPCSGQRAVELLEEWDQFKRTARGLRMFEHHDYVEEAIERRYVPDRRNTGSTNSGATAARSTPCTSLATPSSRSTRSGQRNRCTSKRRTWTAPRCSKRVGGARRRSLTPRMRCCRRVR
jgi:hypothetical protein